MRRLLTQLNSDHILVLALSLFAWAPLLTTAYFFQAHDAPHSIFYLVEFDQTFRDGYLWPRWTPDFAFGYGYPLFNLYAPLTYFVAEALHLLGLGMTAAVKAVYALAFITSGLTAYGFARRLWGRTGGLLAATLYLFVPFHLLEIYVRSAFAEFCALALLPLVLWAFTALVEEPGPRRLAAAALSYGVLILTHHTTTFTFTPFLLAYLAFLLLRRSPSTLFKEREPGSPPWEGGVRGESVVGQIGWLAAAGGLGVGLSAIYLLPLVVEGRYVAVSQWTRGSYGYAKHFVYPGQLLSAFWDYGYSGEGLADGMSFQVGLAALVLAAFVLIWSRRRLLTRWGTLYFFLAAAAVAAWLMTPAAAWLWQALPIIATLVQFPWRLLALTSLCLSLAAGALLVGEERVESPLLVLLLAIVLTSHAYAVPQYTPPSARAESPVAVIDWDRFYPPDRVAMTAWTRVQPTTSPMEQEYLDGQPLTVAGILRGEGQIETLYHGGASDEVRVRSDAGVTAQFYTYYYPGWQALVDGQPTPIVPEGDYGLITLDVPPGDHIVRIRFGDTPVRVVGRGLSLLSAGLLGILISSPGLRRRKRKTGADRR